VPIVYVPLERLGFVRCESIVTGVENPAPTQLGFGLEPCRYLPGCLKVRATLHCAPPALMIGEGDEVTRARPPFVAGPLVDTRHFASLLSVSPHRPRSLNVTI
jgi:hypothetical protein